MIWLQGGSFSIQHKGHSAVVPCTKGVKQGSRGGPFQWNLVTRYLLWQFAQRKGLGWVQDHVLNFADDYHLSWVADSEISLHRAVHDVADFFHLLESAGLQINLGKSAAILKVVGPRLHAFQKNFILRRANGVFLKCKCTNRDTTYHIPIVKRWDYLGSTLSYTGFAQDTVLRRVKAADHAFAKLRNVLGCRRSLALAQRLAVYDTCVLSTLLYAVMATGIGTQEARLIHGTVMRHLRFLANSPRHVTHETNDDLCSRLRRALPLAALKHVWEKKCRAWTDRRLMLHPQDVVGRVPQYPDLLPALTALTVAGVDQAVPPAPWTCRTCSRGFQSPYALKKHITRAHPHAGEAPQSGCKFNPARDARPNTWQCSHCEEAFYRCANLQYHIEQGACQHFQPDKAPDLVPHVGRTSVPSNKAALRRCA